MERPQKLPEGIEDSGPSGWKPMEIERPSRPRTGSEQSTVASRKVKAWALNQALDKKPKVVTEMAPLSRSGATCDYVVDDGSGPRRCGEDADAGELRETVSFRRGSHAKGTPGRPPMLKVHRFCRVHAEFVGSL